VSPPILVVHAHCYQPPRENPWTGDVGRQPTAAPYHDWNERVTAECYRPNGFARIVDDRGRVVAIVDNYAQLSFNVGPTLMAWLERNAPDAYQRMVVADRQRGGALAQAFSHLILPLANERDARTQIRWGLADFAHRFGRDAQGMWLPETAVNEHVMRYLAEEGVAFTILAPIQARRTRPLGGRDWHDVSDGSIDTTRPYRWRHPDGVRGVDIVFYNGPLSYATAFDPTATTSEVLVARAAAAAGDGGLVCVAADGETFGHHQKWADRALAYALAVEAPRRGLRVMNLGEYLADHRPTHEVEVRESAWSCAHGVRRWTDDCGCSTGGRPGEQQAWRAPLRSALDGLRDHGVAVFESKGADALADPWAARDAYVDVIVGARSRNSFAAEHVRGDAALAFTLLKSQHQAMAMYTSCGWFFHDLAGIETIQVLRHAARMMDLLREAGDEPPEEEFLAVLAHAVSNDHQQGDGRQIWQHRVVSARTDGAVDELERRASSVTDGLTASAGALVHENLPLLLDLARRGGTFSEELRATVALGFARVVPVAVGRALTDGAGGISDALEVLELAGYLELYPDIDREQEAVYDALLREDPPAALGPLGAALGLAVESLGTPPLSPSEKPW
jgi:alpha-amylase/alpha-mannosidase (GH57 family)